MTTAYVPRPIDTGSVELPPALVALSEKLAENVHEVWASQRIADGWVHGNERDDARKTHPGLVSYARLSETEKAYDRKISEESIKTIVALGFRILPP